MKADISIVQSKKGTEIMVSGNKINKYGILAAILFTIPILLLFRYDPDFTIYGIATPVNSR